MNALSSLIHVATITTAHGIRGQVKLRSLTTPPEAVFQCKHLSDAAGKKMFSLAAHGVSGHAFIVGIKDVTDRNAAELLRGVEIYAPENEIPDDPHAEIIGCEARLKSGAVYGRVTSIENFGAGDIIEIEKPDGTFEMLPMNDEFVPELHLKKRYIVIVPPDYVEGEE